MNDIFSLKLIDQCFSVGTAALVLVVFLLVAWSVRGVFSKLSKKLEGHQQTAVKLISKVLSVGIILIGIISALGAMGIDISGLIAGLGVTGFVVGFAFKDSLSNVLSGLMIFIYRPFKNGDKIEIDKYSGEVVDINLRYIVLKEGTATILIPNTMALSKVVKLVSQS